MFASIVSRFICEVSNKYQARMSMVDSVHLSVGVGYLFYIKLKSLGSSKVRRESSGAGGCSEVGKGKLWCCGMLWGWEGEELGLGGRSSGVRRGKFQDWEEAFGLRGGVLGFKEALGLGGGSDRVRMGKLWGWEGEVLGL